MNLFSKTLLLLILCASFNLSADSKKRIIFDFSGLTVFKDGNVSVDYTRWNLKTTGSREIYSPNGINKDYKGTIEVVKDEHRKIVGVKQIQGTTGGEQQTYYFKDGIIDIEGGRGTAYTEETCLNNLELVKQYSISKDDNKFFPEFPKKNIVYGRPGKETDPLVPSTKIYSRCEQFWGYSDAETIEIFVPNKKMQAVDAISK